MKPIRIAGLAVLAATVSCSDATGPGHGHLDLQLARQRWRAQNLHTYAFTFQRNCFCANVDPLYVAVVSDTVVEVLDLQTGAALDPRSGTTVEELFTFVQNAIDRHAHLIHAEYDGAKGFPTQIDYDGAEGIADDEVFYSVADVHPISPQQ